MIILGAIRTRSGGRYRLLQEKKTLIGYLKVNVHTAPIKILTMGESSRKTAIVSWLEFKQTSETRRSFGIILIGYEKYE